MALEPRSHHLAELPIRLTELPHWNVELDIEVGLRAVREAHLIDENALYLVDADLVVGVQVQAAEAEQMIS